MAEQFYTILTNTGKAKIANSLPTGTKVNLTTLKVGDSNGTYYNPSETQTDLVHTVYTCNVTSVAVDTTNGNWINITAVIPSDQGGFTIREVGVFDDSGNLIAIGKYPETYKPTASDGSTKELYLKMTLEVSNSSSVTLKIDPTVILATKSDINTLTTSMNNSISSINTQLSDIAQKLKNLVIDVVKDFGADPTGITDSTVAFQNAINYLNSYSSSGFLATNFAGTLYMPSGTYLIGTLTLKSNIKYQGAGMYSTRIKPINNDGSYVFDRTLNNGETMSHIIFENFSVQPDNNWWGTASSTPASVNAFNLTNSVNVLMRNVMVNNISGIGLDVRTCMDSVFDNIWMFYTGVDEKKPAILLGKKDYDISNALKFINCHLEQCSFFLVVGSITNGEEPRQNQFIGCKFENGSTDATTIKLNYSSSTQFVSCMFVNGNVSNPMILLQQCIGDIFSGCSFASANPQTGYMMGVNENYIVNATITGCSFGEYGIAKCIKGKYLNIIGNTFYTVGANSMNVVDILQSTFIGNTVKNIAEGNFLNLRGYNNVANNYIESSSGTKVSIASNANDNRVLFNVFRGVGINLDIEVGAGGNVILNNRADNTTNNVFATDVLKWNYYSDNYSSFVSPINSQALLGALKITGTSLQFHDGTSWRTVNVT